MELKNYQELESSEIPVALRSLIDNDTQVWRLGFDSSQTIKAVNGLGGDLIAEITRVSAYIKPYGWVINSLKIPSTSPSSGFLWINLWLDRSLTVMETRSSKLNYYRFLKSDDGIIKVDFNFAQPPSTEKILTELKESPYVKLLGTVFEEPSVLEDRVEEAFEGLNLQEVVSWGWLGLRHRRGYRKL